MGQEASTTRLKRGETVKPNFKNFYLSSSLAEIEPWYDVIVIGSGYGGAIAASRAARAGQKVCLLERGKEWRPGDFPETEIDAGEEVQMTVHDNSYITGDPTSLYDVIIGPDVTVLQGCGLGGTSLINANVALDCDPRIFDDEVWPQELRENISNMTGDDRQHVYDMMTPRVYPNDFPVLPKLKAMGKAATHMVKDIEDLEVEQVFRRAPLFVNFAHKLKNRIGLPQPPCIGCGNCCAGCNTGAKNTLNMNYLPDAKAHRATIFTEVEVRAITQEEGMQDAWRIHYFRHVQDSFEATERYVKAKIVILGAGSLGSTNILMLSKERGLDVSTNLGKRFTTNGDNIGLCFNGGEVIRPAGIKLAEVEKFRNGPGPCITGIIDMRGRPGKGLEEGYVLADGTPPSSVTLPFMFLLQLANAKEPTSLYKRTSADNDLREYRQVISSNAYANTLPLLAMSNDNAGGQLKLDAQNSRVWIHYPDVGDEHNLKGVEEGMKSATEGLEGEFFSNPYWAGVISKLNDTKGIVTVHPLGGCAMADSGIAGVVNHAGQVFKGNTSEVHPGLYVVDGAIIPRSLGVSPALTIAMVAERCMRLMADQHGWRIDYQKWRHMRHDGKVVTTIPGIRFTEKMSGKLMYNNQPHQCKFILTIETQDVERMITLDQNHSAQIYGKVTCAALSESPLTVSNGRFQLFSRSHDKVETREMVYKMVINSEEGKSFHIKGIKLVHKDSALELGFKDTTVLNITIHEGKTEEGNSVGTGKLLLTFNDLMKQMESFEVIKTDSALDKLLWKAKFGKFFMGILWETYGALSPTSCPFNPDSPPREKRPLRLNEAKPEVFGFQTTDGVMLALTHYKGGDKGPVLLGHGMGVSSRIYTLDTIDKNFVEFLLEHEYDVWVLEWRASILLHAHELQHTIDDLGQYDIPKAVNRVLEETGAKDLLVFVHCVGSIGFFMSMLSGQLTGKIRCIIASQVAFCTVPSKTNWLKAHTRVPNILYGLGIEGLSAYTDSKAGLKSRLVNRVVGTYSDLTTHFEEHCSNRVCHRITFMYGLMWEHKNLNQLTHATVHEIFGYGTATFFKHLSVCMRKQHLVDAQGKSEPYLPDFDSKRRLESTAYMEHMKRLDVPILFYSGEQNRAFPPLATLRAYERCKEANPDQHYERLVFPGYGHLDHMMGKTVEEDIFKKLLPFLEKYAGPTTNSVTSECTDISGTTM